MIDSLTIFVQAGKGGDGRVSFKREKFKPFGGPDGGDGGKGGDVILKVNPKLRTLSHLKNKKTYKASPGEYGGTNFRQGKSGKDLIIEVPPGTLVYKVVEGKKKLLADLNQEDMSLVVAKGGKGGFGNAHFKSSTNRTPKKATLGFSGESFELFLEIKLLADIGLVGLPSVGKSSLVNLLTRRSFKTASYPFTTLSPNIGVLHLDKLGDLIIADLPGLIEGASLGRGLGDQFLKHIERCGLIIHVLDISNTKSFLEKSEDLESISKEVLQNYLNIRKEMKEWSNDLLKKPEILVLNKIDIPKVGKVVDYVSSFLSHNLPEYHNISGNFLNKYYIFKVSSYTGEGIEDLIKFLKNNYTYITSLSHKASFSKSKSKIYRIIDLNNVPNKRIVYKD